MGKYLIWTPDYRNNSGGIRALHRLCHLLNRRGQEAYVSNPIVNKDWNTLYLDPKNITDDFIAVYPEIVWGNPFGAKKVVRYVLNTPGLLGGAKSYSETVFTWNKISYDAPLLKIDVIENFFNNSSTAERTKNCFWVGKGKDIPRVKETKDLTEITLDYPKTREELSSLLKSTKVFYSYDGYSGLPEEAYRCGCEVKIITEKGIEEYNREWYTKDLDFDKQLDNFIEVTQKIEKKDFVTIIIVTYNSQEVLDKCFEGLSKAGYQYKIIVIDNNSNDKTYLNKQGVDYIINDRNYNFTHAVNQGLKLAQGNVLLLNPDCMGNLQDGWLKQMVDDLDGVAGAILKFPDGKIQHAGAFGFGAHTGMGEEDKGQYDKVREVEWVTGACMLIKKEVIDKVGLWDEIKFPHYESDREWCKKVKEAGYKIVCSTAKLTHLEGKSSKGLNVSGKKLRILWHSNSAWTPTGYGNQTALVTQGLQKTGYPMAISSYYGLQGGILNMGGIICYPIIASTWGEDSIVSHSQDFKADIVITLMDIWPMNTSLFANKVKWISWCPVDHEEVPPPVLVRAREAYKVIAYSKHGQRAFKRAGIDALYIPHCIDTKIFNPRDKKESRKIFNIPEDSYCVGMVAQNKSLPSRKSFQQSLEAFANFAKDKPNARLYLHTAVGTEQGGMNLIEYCIHLGIADKLIHTAYYNYLFKFSSEDLAKLYSSFDVLLNPAMGEGFGIPVIESQACGTPVIVGNWTSMPELLGSGIAVESSEKWWTPLASYQYHPKMESILEALEKIYKGDKEEYKRKAVEFTKAYDVDKIIKDYWVPYLESL